MRNIDSSRHELLDFFGLEVYSYELNYGSKIKSKYSIWRRILMEDPGFRSLGRQQLESELRKIREPSADLFGIQLEVSQYGFGQNK